MKAKTLLLRIIQKKPSLTRFHVAKLAYLFDLAYVQLTGEPSTDIPYEWNWYGPYSKEIDKRLWDLHNQKKIKISPYKTSTNHDCFLHLPIDKTRPRIKAEAERILDYIINKYGDMTTDQLKEFVYNTPPMKEAQKKDMRFEELDLRSHTGIPESLYDTDTARMILDSEMTDRRKYASLKVFLKKFQSQPA